MWLRFGIYLLRLGSGIGKGFRLKIGVKFRVRVRLTITCQGKALINYNNIENIWNTLFVKQFRIMHAFQHH